MILLPLKIKEEKIYKSFMLVKLLQLVFVSTILMVLPLNSTAQKTLEIGAFGGGSYYLGDINPAILGMGFLLASGSLLYFSRKIAKNTQVNG